MTDSATTSPQTRERDYDIAIFGATGFVGELTAQDLALHGAVANPGLKVALAGRNRNKLEQVKKRLGRTAENWQIITVDAASEAEVTNLANLTRVIITTVGPYAKYGLPLARACAEAGTHYVDLTGEVLFAREVIDGCDAAANRTGARIVNSCGYDSVPSDIGVFVLDAAIRANGDGDLTDTTTYASLKGGFSGGTIASAMEQADQMADQPQLKKIAGDKFALSPNRSAEPRGEFKDSLKVWYSNELNVWVAPFVMASYNTRVVRRSNALLDYAYGKDFKYREVMKVGRGLAGRAKAMAVAAGLAAGFAALATPKLRPVVNKIVAQPGTGPSDEDRENGFFKMDIRTKTTTGVPYRCVFSGKGDPGYKSTAVMLSEAALTLVESPLTPLPNDADGGCFTPAVGLGMPYVERLRVRGFTISAARLSL